VGQEESDKARENSIILRVWSSPNINGVIESSRMRCHGRVACMGEVGNAHRLWMEDQKGLDHFDRRTICNHILMEHGVCEVSL
jgi:hypothetical protein